MTQTPIETQASTNKAVQKAQEKIAATQTTEVATQQQPQTFQKFLESMKTQIAMALPKHVDTDRIMRAAMTAYNTNPKLRECETRSIIAALMTSAQLGLEPNTPLGQAFIIPYRKNGVSQAQFQLGYKGVIDLCYNTGQFKRIEAHEVYAQDHFKCEYGLYPVLEHRHANNREGNPIGYWGLYELKNGGVGYQYVTREEIVKHAKKYSKSYGESYSSAPWQTDFDEMAKKTVLMMVLKYAPKSIEVNTVISDAMQSDESIKTLGTDDNGKLNTVTIDIETGEVIQ